MRIATLGPKGTFSHEAVLKRNNKAEIIFKNTVWDIFDAVDNNEVDEGIVPLENSVSGTVGLTLDALMEFDLNIIVEITLPVKHLGLSSCLLNRSTWHIAIAELREDVVELLAEYFCNRLHQHSIYDTWNAQKAHPTGLLWNFHSKRW